MLDVHYRYTNRDYSTNLWKVFVAIITKPCGPDYFHKTPTTFSGAIFLVDSLVGGLQIWHHPLIFLHPLSLIQLPSWQCLGWSPCALNSWVDRWITWLNSFLKYIRKKIVIWSTVVIRFPAKIEMAFSQILVILMV